MLLFCFKIFRVLSLIQAAEIRVTWHEIKDN